ncbi:gp49 [Corynebacterium phage BFK20]|uniref:Gp49 n=1 Tax=Corynebacterium phage BFK20 TaxID=28358 RepID=Q3V5E6_9CAUD|nr:gp49 [Corynebacterium phage BFK20]CAJ29732.1 gp49 [Corynebacterium phage BFK20]
MHIYVNKGLSTCPTLPRPHLSPGLSPCPSVQAICPSYVSQVLIPRLVPVPQRASLCPLPLILICEDEGLFFNFPSGFTV